MSAASTSAIEPPGPLLLLLPLLTAAAPLGRSFSSISLSPGGGGGATGGPLGAAAAADGALGAAAAAAGAAGAGELPAVAAASASAMLLVPVGFHLRPVG